MTADWTPVFVLPKIPLETAISCDIAALAPAHDRRVATLKRTHPMLRRFLNRFADNFGQKFEPAVLILNTAALPVFRDVSALASLRDLIAVCAVNRDKVFEVIERTPWAIPASGQLAHDTGGKTKVKRTLASWLYQVLYECRNDFLHGNPVERSNLVLSTPQRTIFEYAAPLYRIALTAFLPLTHAAPTPSADDCVFHMMTGIGSTG